METKGGGGFCEVVEEALAIFVLIGFHALLDVEFTVFEQAVDDSSQLMGGGGDGRDCAQPGFHASVKRTQSRFALVQRSGGDAQSVGDRVQDMTGMAA